MRNSDELFELIRSLTKAEKRYFKLAVSVQKGNKNYLRLFDMIDKQKEYNEEAILNLFSGEKITKHLHVVKNYLYNLILDCLHIYHMNLSVDATLKKQLHTIKILFEKGLYKQCEKLIAKAKQVATHYENHLQLLELSNWEAQLIWEKSFSGKTEEEMENSYQKEFSIMEKYRNYREYSLLGVKISVNKSKKGKIQHIEDLAIYKKNLDHSLFDSEKNALSFRAKMHFYDFHNIFLSAQKDYVNGCIYSEKAVKLFEENSHQIKENLQLYIHTLKNLIINLFNLKRYDESFITINKLEKINNSSTVLKKKNLIWIIHAKLALYSNTGRFDEGVALIEEIKNDFRKSGDSIFYKEIDLLLKYNICSVYVGSECYIDANTWLNEILNDSSTDLRSDIYSFSRILHLIVHFELGNEELLEYAVKSTYRFLYKRKRIYKIETGILNFIGKKLPKIKSQQDLMEAFKELRAELIEILKDPFEKKALDYFDFISWLNSKIENRSFAEIVKEKTLMK